MSVLESFYILFKSNSSEFSKELKGVKNSVESLGRELVSFLAVGASFHAVLSQFKSAVDYLIQLDQASRQLQVSTESLDAWGNAVRRTGGSLEGFQQSLKGLAGHLGSSTKTAMAVLPQLADVFQRLGQTRSLIYGKQLGLDEHTILLLQTGRKEVELAIQRQKELGLVTKQDAEIARKFNFELQDFGHAVRSVFVSVGTEVLPILSKLLDFFITGALYIRKHADLIIGAFIAIGAAGLWMAAPLLITTGIVFGLIAAFALLYEDIKYFIEGHESLTGKILAKWPAIGKGVSFEINRIKQHVEFLIEVFKELWHIMGLVGQGFGKVYDFFQGNPALSSLLKAGQLTIQGASSSPLTAQTSNSILNQRSANREINVTTGAITIQTQSDDAYGIQNVLTNTLGQSLKLQLDQLNNDVADGVYI